MVSEVTKKLSKLLGASGRAELRMDKELFYSNYHDVRDIFNEISENYKEYNLKLIRFDDGKDKDYVTMSFEARDVF
ncbi:hypothetical protein [Methanobrevibacter sp.]|uniref:hypothetical protein n=1 Tax=Methanobrevibacter sp. TaxID=66852 RepID=UPI00388FD41F